MAAYAKVKYEDSMQHVLTSTSAAFSQTPQPMRNGLPFMVALVFSQPSSTNRDATIKCCIDPP